MELYSKRLKLREARLSDVDDLAMYQSDSRYLEHYETVPNAVELIVQFIAWSEETPRANYQFIITLLNSDRAIGSAGLRTQNYIEKTAELGIELDPDYWGERYASEVLACLIEFAKSQELTHLVAVTKQSNTIAQALVVSAGFTLSKTCGLDNIYIKELKV